MGRDIGLVEEGKVPGLEIDEVKRGRGTIIMPGVMLEGGFDGIKDEIGDRWVAAGFSGRADHYTDSGCSSGQFCNMDFPKEMIGVRGRVRAFRRSAFVSRKYSSKCETSNVK